MGKAYDIPERTDIALLERTVSMSNKIARAAQGLTLVEKRIIALGLAKTDSVPAKDLMLANREGWKIRFTAAEYSESYEVTLDAAYQQMKAAGDHFLKRTIRRLETDHKGRLIEYKSNWLSGTTYHHGEGWVEIRFTYEVAPHLLGLRAQFTSYKLKQASALRSVYAWRLFECLQSWKQKGIWTTTIEQFNYMMETPESFQKDFGMMRRRVIEPAMKELRNKGNLEIELELKKSGRKVTDLIFRFSTNPQEQLPL
jgi:plasmid replication initiation protein